MSNETSDSPISSGWGVGIESNTYVRATYGFIALFGITGNSLVCYAFLTIPELRTRTSQLIIHLGVTDLLTCIWIIPFHFFPASPDVPNGFLGELLCRLFFSKYPLWVTVFASVYSLLSISVERFVAIVYPLQYKRIFTVKRSYTIMVLCWIVGIFSNGFFFYAYYLDPVTIHCGYRAFPTYFLQVLNGTYIFCLIYTIPITFNVIAHLYMIRVLRAQATAIKKGNHTIQMEGGVQNANRSKAWQLKAAQELEKTLLVVVITFAICWAPNQLIFYAYNLGGPIDFTKPYYHFSVILALCNSCMNPIIYTLKNRYFRRGLMHKFGCGRCRRFTIEPSDSMISTVS